MIKNKLEKKYVVDVHCTNDYANVPFKAKFTITREKAKEIIRLARLVKDNDLHKVERFDYSAGWVGKDIRTDLDCLNVDKEDFYFTAMLKHTSVSFETELVPIARLARYFGITQ